MEMPAVDIKIWVPIIASIVTCAGAVILAYFNHGFSDATLIRKELRERCEKLEGYIKAITDDIDKWKEKYFEAINENNELKQRLLHLIEDSEMQKNKYEALALEHAKLKIRCRAILVQLEDIKTKYLPKSQHGKYGHKPEDADQDENRNH